MKRLKQPGHDPCNPKLSLTARLSSMPTGGGPGELPETPVTITSCMGKSTYRRLDHGVVYECACLLRWQDRCASRIFTTSSFDFPNDTSAPFRRRCEPRFGTGINLRQTCANRSQNHAADARGHDVSCSHEERQDCEEASSLSLVHSTTTTTS